jgi:hypothetical protein
LGEDDLRVVIPYHKAALHPRVVPAVTAQGYEPTLIEIVNEVGHRDSYPVILAKFLLSGDDVCFIEHDNESRPGFLTDLEQCPEPWCFFAYDFSITYEEAIGEVTPDHAKRSPTSAPLGTDFAPLGHTRFKSGVGNQIAETLTSDFFLATWVSRDTLIAEALNELGYLPHRHRGKCFHHHPYAV